MLTGSALIQLVKENPNMTRSQLAVAAGYTRVTDEGKTQVLVQKFYDALLAAQGLTMKKGSAEGVSRGKTAQYETTIHKSGILLIGKVYTAEFGAEPGDVFGIEVRDDGIWLPLKERDLTVRQESVNCKITPSEPVVVEEEEEELVAA